MAMAMSKVESFSSKVLVRKPRSFKKFFYDKCTRKSIEILLPTVFL